MGIIKREAFCCSFDRCWFFIYSILCVNENAIFLTELALISFLIFFRVAFIVSGRRRVAHLPRHLEEKKILRSTRSLTSLRKRGIFFSTRFSLPIDPLPTSKKSHDLSIKLTLVVRLFRVVPYRRIFLGITNCQAEKRILFSHVPNLGLCRRMLFFRSFQHVKYVVKRSKGANLGRRRFNSLFAHF